MVRKFTARYKDKDELSHMISVMKDARKQAGFSQEQFGRMIGISRETVVHIEGLVECTVLSLECEVLKRWYLVCADHIGDYDRGVLQAAIAAYLFSPAVCLNDKVAPLPATNAIASEEITATSMTPEEQYSTHP